MCSSGSSRSDFLHPAWAIPPKLDTPWVSFPPEIQTLE